MKHKHLAVFDNEFLQSSYSLTLNEKRVLWATVAKINHSTKISSDTWYEVDLKEFAKIAGIVPKKAYSEARTAVGSLKRKEYTLYYGKIKVICNFFSEILLDEENKILKARFSPSFIPYISELTEKYNKMDLYECFKIRSTYTWRFYDIFKTMDGQLKHRRYPTVTLYLEELYDIVLAKSSYRTFGEFNKHILKPMVKELEELEIAKVIITPVKVGRKTEKIKFIVIWWRFVDDNKHDEEINEILKENNLETAIFRGKDAKINLPS